MCAPIPLTSLAEDIAALQRAIGITRGPLLLAGHAYAGAVIAGAKDDRMKSLVNVAALAPDVFYRAKPHPEARRISSRMAWADLDARRRFCARVAHKASPDQTTILEVVQRPIAVKCIQEKAPVPAWKRNHRGFS